MAKMTFTVEIDSELEPGLIEALQETVNGMRRNWAAEEQARRSGPPRQGQCKGFSQGMWCVLEKGHAPMVGPNRQVFEHNFGGLGPYGPSYQGVED